MVRRIAPSAIAMAFACLAVPATARDIAFVHVNVVPMDRDRVLRDQTVLVRDGRITAVGSKVTLPADADIVDGKGVAWLSPGLADMHIHSDTRDDMAVYLANGVTTVVNMGDARSGFVGRTAPASTRGDIPGPRVFNAFIIDGSADYGHFVVKDAEEARAAVRLAKTNGYRLIKVYNNLSPEAFDAAIGEARRLGLPVAGHGVTRVGLRKQAEASQALIAHAEEFFYTFFSAPGTEQTDTPPPDSAIPSAIELAKRYRVSVGADLITYGAIMRAIGHPEVVTACAANGRHVSPADRLAWRRSNYVGKTADLRRKYAFLQRMVKAMAEAGVELLAGTDAPTIPCVAPGTSLHDDLDELEAAGLSRFQALSTATRMPGAFLRRTLNEPVSGEIAVGARADLILSERNPLDGFATLRQPLGVMVAGHWHDQADLRAMLDTVATAYPDERDLSGQ